MWKHNLYLMCVICYLFLLMISNFIFSFKIIECTYIWIVLQIGKWCFFLLLINIALLKQYGNGFMESIFYFMSLILPNHKLSEYKFTYCPRWHKPEVWTNIGENSFLGLRKQWRFCISFRSPKDHFIRKKKPTGFASFCVGSALL